jgi:sugar phosphate isomerase/epimerase
MKLGFVSAILPDLSLEEVLSFASETRYECVEVMCWPKGRAERRYAGVTHIDVNDLSPARVDEIHRLTAKHDVSISGLGYYPNLLSPNEDEAKTCHEHLKRVIEGAQKLGIDTVNTFIGRDWTKSIDGNWPRFKAIWPALIDHAKEHGVKIGIENCPMSFTQDEWPGGKNLAISPAIWRRMFTEIPNKNFGLNYDPSHMIWQQMDYLKPIREFADRLVHVHAKDVRIDKDRLDDVGILATPAEYHTPKLPGLGDVNWGRFFAVLGDVGYHGPVCVEVEDRAYEGTLESRKASLRQSQHYLSQFMPGR